MKKIILVMILFCSCTTASITKLEGTGGIQEGTGGSVGIGGVSGTGGTPGTGGTIPESTGGVSGTGGNGTGGMSDGTGGFIDGGIDSSEDTTMDVINNITSPGDLIITEIMYDCAAVSDDVGEWFELHNVSNKSIDLYNCSISDTAHTEIIFKSTIVQPNKYVTLARFTDRTMGGFSPDYAYSLIKLSDTGDSLKISCNGSTIDYVDFTMSQLLQGYSLSKDQNGNWCFGQSIYNATSKGSDHGSPGIGNPDCVQ